MSRLIATGSAVSLAWLAGCTVDSIIVLKHPASVGKGETFAVGAVDIILDAGPSSQAADSVRRDSLHVGLGLPAGWEVISAKACPAAHFRPTKASVNRLDTNLRNRLIQDTSAACEARAVPLSPDSGVRAFLKGRAFRVNASPDSLGRSFTVRTDTVPQWFGFAGRIDVFVPAGQAADTVFDATAFKALPVYVYFTLKAPGRDTSVRLIYFSKTGALDTAAFADPSNQDRGSMVYRPVAVGSPVRARQYPAGYVSRRLTVLRSSAGPLHIGLPGDRPASGWSLLEVRASSGAVLRAWSPGAFASGALVWDGADAMGRPLPAGRYLLYLSGPAGSMARPFVLLP